MKTKKQKEVLNRIYKRWEKVAENPPNSDGDVYFIVESDFGLHGGRVLPNGKQYWTNKEYQRKK
ncbi:MAG: hypothetical protein KA369_05700 [Spirochaetes bacterium]|nr:hypothetical protein [Spirochaetota bacterium]